MIIMNVEDGTSRDSLGRLLEGELRDLGHDVDCAVPMSYTLDVPKGAVTR